MFWGFGFEECISAQMRVISSRKPVGKRKFVEEKGLYWDGFFFPNREMHLSYGIGSLSQIYKKHNLKIKLGQWVGERVN
ncbi:MAG: hypothetical protein CM15mP109_05140 [Candidatus Dadabacteria bacterium]|nr:MAG: hypothetical protein CM15mP109_05140 [Candidatus Dadabacteria bacterium]